VRALAGIQVDALPPGPSRTERERETLFTVLEIEDRLHDRVIDWGFHTPNPYDFTAQVVIEVARKVAMSTDQYGWLTPAEVLTPSKEDLGGRLDYLRGCRLFERRTAALEVAR
jgi:hypothetical protein